MKAIYFAYISTEFENRKNDVHRNIRRTLDHEKHATVARLVRFYC